MTVLRLDLAAPTRPHSAIWSFGGGVESPALLLRQDVRRHVLMCRDECGLRHVAIDDVLGEASAARPAFDPDRIESNLDWLLENGITPFLHLIPSAGWDAGQSRAALVALITHIDGRYGCDAREWFFELGRADGDREPFEASAAAMKQIHPEYRAGVRLAGPAAELPHCDFVTADGEADIQASRAAAGNLPVIVIGDKNVSSGDSCGRAALAAQTVSRWAESCAGIIWQDMTDIDSAALHQATLPFHAGRGLITVNDIRKPAFHLLRLMNEHGGYHGEQLQSQWTDAPPGLGCIATRSETTLRLLAWLSPDAAGPARFQLEGLPESVTMGHVEVIRPLAGSAVEEWVRLEKPTFVNRHILEMLELSSLPAQADVDFREYPPRLEPGMVMQLTIDLPYSD